MEEKDVFEKVINFIKLDGNIKTAILNGSRANPNAPRDFMQDYDIALYVDSLEESQKYKENQNWVSLFGDLVILQQNNFEDNAFIFLLQYADSLRIDLSFHDIKSLKKHIEEDSLSIVLYDKDKITGEIPKPDESTYYVQKPTEQKWEKTLNELWWLQVYISKELWRDEIPLAKELYDIWLISCLRELISWHIAIEKNWTVNVGHGGKWFKRLLPQELYEEYIYFYSSADIEEQWQKLLNIGNFIRKIAQPLSVKLGYKYPLTYDANVSSYIRRIVNLKQDAAAL